MKTYVLTEEQMQAVIDSIDGVIRVADRKTVEFDAARYALKILRSIPASDYKFDTSTYVDVSGKSDDKGVTIDEAVKACMKHQAIPDWFYTERVIRALSAAGLLRVKGD